MIGRMPNKLRAALKDGSALSQDLDEHEILELLQTGEAILFDHQDEPPWFLLGFFESSLDKVEKFGPEGHGNASLNKISNGLILSGVRQLLVEGRSIGWCKKKHDLLEAANKVLGSHPSGDWDVWADVKRILRVYREKCERRVSAHGRTPSNALGTVRWIGCGNFLNKTREYIVLDPEWSKFDERTTFLAGQLEITVRNALVSGRIICCEDGAQGARVVPPSFFSPAWKSGGDHYYCFTRDLPKAWFSTSGQLRTRRRAAAEWMNETYLSYQSQGRHAAIGDLKIAAVEKFELKQNAINQAWRDFEPKPSKPGNSSPSKRVSLKEIRDLIKG